MTKHILIVEDDNGLREGIALALQGENVTFMLCGTLKEARTVLAKKGEAPFQLVLLDLNLPDGSGYELLKEIKENSDIPVIILTANDLEMDEVKGLMLGADDYITKPFSLMVLRARIDKVLKNAVKSKADNASEAGKENIPSGNFSSTFGKCILKEERYQEKGRNYLEQNRAEAFAIFGGKSKYCAWQGQID